MMWKSLYENFYKSWVFKPTLLILALTWSGVRLGVINKAASMRRLSWITVSVGINFDFQSQYNSILKISEKIISELFILSYTIYLNYTIIFIFG